MPAEDSLLGPSNKWYKTGLEDLWKGYAKEVEIHILPAPAYLAAKFEAFNSRGGDYRTSHDFEDIIYILDNRSTIVCEIEIAHIEIKEFLKSEFHKILHSRFLEEILNVHIHPLMQKERTSVILEKLNQIMNC
jgi:hypothetical protein